MDTDFYPDLVIEGVRLGDRVEKVRAPLTHYAEAQGLAGEHIDSIASDLLTDLMHLANACGHAPRPFLDRAVAQADIGYDEESDLSRHDHAFTDGEAPRRAAEPIAGEFNLCDGPRYFVVQGRLPGKSNVTELITIPAGSDEDPWEVFVEDTLYEGDVAGPEDDPDDYALPYDWASDGRKVIAGDQLGAWAYRYLVIQMPGPAIRAEWEESK